MYESRSGPRKQLLLRKLVQAINEDVVSMESSSELHANPKDLCNFCNKPRHWEPSSKLKRTIEKQKELEQQLKRLKPSNSMLWSGNERFKLIHNFHLEWIMIRNWSTSCLEFQTQSLNCLLIQSLHFNVGANIVQSLDYSTLHSHSLSLSLHAYWVLSVILESTERLSRDCSCHSKTEVINTVKILCWDGTSSWDIQLYYGFLMPKKSNQRI